MIKITVIDYLKNKFLGKKSIELTDDELSAMEIRQSAYSSFKVAELALFTAIDLIAKTLSKCRFCTVENGKEVEKSEFYAWNYAPNRHQTKSEFIIEAVSKLLFYNEVLIFETHDGQRLIAENFSKETKALYDDVFTNVSARGWSSGKTYYSSDVIYLKYNCIAIRGLLSRVCSEYEEMMITARRKYKRSGSQKVVAEFSTSATNDKDFKERFNRLLNEDFVAYFGDGDVVLPIYEGMKITDTSSSIDRKATENDVNDITKLRDAAVQIVAQTFHISPALIRGEASQLGEAKDEFIADAVDPVAQIFEQGITTACYGENGVRNGNYLHIDTTYAKHYDALDSADKAYKSIGSRIISPAQAQRYCNMVPDNDASARAYYMTKNNQTADLAVAEGGENNA